MKLELDGVTCRYGKKTVVHELSLSLVTGEILALFGPNGAGKTSLFKTVLGLMSPAAGKILINGKSLERYSPGRRAGFIAYVPQSRQTAFPYRVDEVVLMGRFASPGKNDRDAVRRALEELEIGRLADHIYTRLSGGEQQMVLLARALAQETDFLIMDEPLSHLDYGKQHDFLGRMKTLAQGGRGILFTTHSPDHVLLCAHRAALMREGRLVSQGATDRVMTPENMKMLYAMETIIGEATESTPPYCLPLSGKRRNI